MIAQMAPEKNHSPRPLDKAVRHTIRFASVVKEGDPVLMEFADPAPVKAVRCARVDAHPDEMLDILAVPGVPNEDAGILDEMTKWVMESHRPGMALPITITLHGTQVVWHSARIAILASPERTEALILALVDFGFYERELMRLERTIAAGWRPLEANSSLAFEVTNDDLERREELAAQCKRMLDVRMRHARIWPHLNRPGTNLSSLANQLGERLREKTGIEDRLEFMDSHLEVFEQVYEMSSHRMSEFRAAKQSSTLEWVIIVLLAAETILLVIEVLLNLQRG